MRSATVVLPVPGLPVKDMCKRRRSGDESELLAGALDEQERGDVAHALPSTGFKSDQLAVEFVEHLVHVRFGEQRAQVDAAQASPSNSAACIALPSPGHTGS